MKRLTSLMLALLLVVGVLGTPALAAGEDYTFTLSVNGKSEDAVLVGDTITVTMQIKSNRADGFDLYGMQNYITFDSDCLEFVPGSEEYYKKNDFPVIFGSVLPAGNQLFTNRASRKALALQNDDVLVQFQVRATQAGQTDLTSLRVEMIGQNAESYPVTVENAALTITEPHRHTMKLVPEVPATETAAGVKAHWVCTGCGKTFLDEAGTKPATSEDLLLPKKDHVHVMEHIPGIEPTETVLGLKEHWRCTGCGKTFLDEAGTQEVSSQDLFLPKKDHVHTLLAIQEQLPTVEKIGMKAHWVCTGCGKRFLDEAGTLETTQEALVIPKLKPLPQEPDVPQNPALPQQPVGFTDVAEDAWYAQAVRWAVENHITEGAAPGLFAPEQACTRAQVVTFLWRAAGSPEPKAAQVPFVDVPTDAWYTKAVLWAVENHITEGTGNGKFSPENVVTRGQVVTFLHRSKGLEAPNTGVSFTDVASDAWYAQAVQWAAARHITEGTGNGKFSPDAACTRGQIVTFLWRAE